MKPIAYTEAATLQVRRLPAAVRERVTGKLRRYAETGSGDVTRLKGREGARLRVGDYRVIFTETAEGIEVHAVGHRRDVYD